MPSPSVSATLGSPHLQCLVRANITVVTSPPNSNTGGSRLIFFVSFTFFIFHLLLSSVHPTGFSFCSLQCVRSISDITDQRFCIYRGSHSSSWPWLFYMAYLHITYLHGNVDKLQYNLSLNESLFFNHRLKNTFLYFYSLYTSRNWCRLADVNNNIQQSNTRYTKTITLISQAKCQYSHLLLPVTLQTSQIRIQLEFYLKLVNQD